LVSDLAPVKPSPGPKLDLLYIDFQYDDVDTNYQNPQVFKYTDANLVNYQNAINNFLNSSNGYGSPYAYSNFRWYLYE
jgi:hypothetical protein